MIEYMSFSAWWNAYNEAHQHVIGGKEWMAAYAAWHYRDAMANQELEDKNSTDETEAWEIGTGRRG